MVAQYANLNRLLEQGAEPRGRRSATGERSTPTGWVTKKENVGGQELEFGNGYRVLAVQVEGQKAVIKGPEAWLNWYRAMEAHHIQSVVGEWLERLAKESSSTPAAKEAHRAVAETKERPSDDRVDALEAKVTGLEAGVGEILSLLKQTKS